MHSASFSVVTASTAHIPHLAANMREADRREVMASHGLGPIEALRGSFERSATAWTLMIENVPVAMGGVCPAGGMLSLTGRPWLLATPAMERAPRTLLARWSRLYVGTMLRLFPRLENHVHAGNRLSIRWLQWCGFTIDDVPEVINDEDFYLFWKEAPCANQ